MKNALKYIIIWLLPAILLCACGYFYLHSVIIYFIGEGKWERLDGFAYLVMGFVHTLFLIVTMIIALIITIRTKKKAVQ